MFYRTQKLEQIGLQHAGDTQRSCKTSSRREETGMEKCKYHLLKCLWSTASIVKFKICKNGASCNELL